MICRDDLELSLHFLVKTFLLYFKIFYNKISIHVALKVLQDQVLLSSAKKVCVHESVPHHVFI